MYAYDSSVADIGLWQCRFPGRLDSLAPADIATPSTKKWATWRMLTALKAARLDTQRPMNLSNRESGNAPEAPSVLEELCPLMYALEMYRWQKGTSEFLYVAELDVFRFPEDSRFALCEEFVDWKELRERGYWLF